MEILVTVLVIFGGILGCIFVFLVDQTFTWRERKQFDLVKTAEKAEYIVGFFSLVTIFAAVLLSNI